MFPIDIMPEFIKNTFLHERMLDFWGSLFFAGVLVVNGLFILYGSKEFDDSSLHTKEKLRSIKRQIISGYALYLLAVITAVFGLFPISMLFVLLLLYALCIGLKQLFVFHLNTLKLLSTSLK